MKMKPKIAVFTDTNISRQVFSRFALGNSPKAEQPTPVPQEVHVQWEYQLLSVVAAYIVGGPLTSVSIQAAKKCQCSTCTLTCVTHVYLLPTTTDSMYTVYVYYY